VDIVDGYKTSKNYDKLFDILKSCNVVCFVKKKQQFRVCEAKFSKNKKHISVGTVGIGYIEAFPFKEKNLKEDFIEQCKYWDLSYIVPDCL